jgi:hypothetical protein
MTVNIQLDTMFKNAQVMATLQEGDPNPHRTMYVRLIGELEAVLIDGYRNGNKKTQAYMENFLESIIKRQLREIDALQAKRCAAE